VVVTQAANLVTASRFGLAVMWLLAFRFGYGSPGVLGSIAVAGAFSDFIDGQVARHTHSADALGRWLDNLADIVFVLTALICEASAGAIPLYMPALIAASFAQYTIDSILIRRSPSPVRSRLGHWGGVLNFLLVIVLSFAPPPRLAGTLVRNASPLIAVFYIAAMLERALGYRWCTFNGARQRPAGDASERLAGRF
jgi:phosphatidylglycerophosphate synthase